LIFLSESFDYEAYQQQYGHRALPLFTIDHKEKLHFFTPDELVEPKEEWTVVSLIQEKEDDKSTN